MKKSRMFIHPCPEQQPDAAINQPNPTNGTEYIILDTTKNVRINSISAQCTWAVQPSPLQIHVYIDDKEIIYGKSNPVTETNYYADASWSANPEATQNLASTSSADNQAFLIEGRSVKITAEITGGTVSALVARVKWAKW